MLDVISRRKVYRPHKLVDIFRTRCYPQNEILSASKMTNPVISVVTPVYNGGENFLRCLSSVNQALLPSSELIVVVDGPDQRSYHMAQKYTKNVLQLPIRGGPAQARNFGASAARGEILLFLDADVAVPPETLHQVVQIFKNQPDLDALFGSYDDEPGAKQFLSQYRNLLHHYIHQTSRDDASTFWGACGAVRRDVFFAVGGFSERYPKPSIEDIELGYRLKQAGYRIQLCRSLQVKHLKKWSASSLLRTDFFDRAIPWARLILAKRKMPDDLNLRTSSRMSVVLIFASVGFLGWFLRRPCPAILSLLFISNLTLLLINFPLYYFFKRKKGWWFAARAIPWHWFYYL